MALWTPSDFGAALVAWFDAQDAASLTIEGATVSGWANKGSGGSLVQTVEAARPIHGAGAWDGALPALTGDGVNDVMAVASSPPLGDYWWFAAAERDTQDDSNSTIQRPILTTTRGAGAAVAILGPERPTADAAQTNLTARGAGAGAGVAMVTGFDAGDKAVVFMEVGATLRLRMNGGAEQTAATGATTYTQFRIFADTNTARSFKGKIAEVVGIDPTALPGGGSEAERQVVEGYLAWRWGMEAALTPGHPYESAAPTTGGGDGQALTPPLLTSAPSLFAPTITPGAVQLAAPLLSSEAVLFAPVAAPGAVTLAPPLIDSQAAIHAPAVSPGAVTLTPPLIAAEAQLFSPSVTPGAVRIFPPALAGGATMFAPVVTGGEQIELTIRADRLIAGRRRQRDIPGRARARIITGSD